MHSTITDTSNDIGIVLSSEISKDILSRKIKPEFVTWNSVTVKARQFLSPKVFVESNPRC